MLTIRLFRVGRKNQPAFKIVVCDKQNAASRGRFVEEVGFYDPLTKQRNLKGDRVKYWLSVGAKASPTVHNMLVTDKVVEGPKIAKHKLSKKPASPIGGPASPNASQGGPAEQATEQAVPPKAEETPDAPETTLPTAPENSPSETPQKAA
ncbi:MAG: 30S ribosomal protein S16 [Candidatus Wildermuthbacteria bacterium RIFCSPHIGHO2_01_FULL_48_27b]|uniref:Small ribosomal subunit protein bS16 n=1 Tax=Candidatus Wildermuthbacteria bacterium RIFCSPHIGHO2_01_FULL_48_27b TaxID=1802447 RepID=A0A1G2QTT2_9BACT|nr:MAG: 30S ribosomal protein S16 [Candidatus Wildermuthbacteria bacterium RIFCSPHIGHO2_01_FULL_48_27b]